MFPSPCCLRPLLVGLLLVRGLVPAAAAPLVTQVVETGGLNEATDTITARFTGQTFTNGIVGEFFYPYSIPAFGEDVPAYVDRIHQWNGATPAGLPPYLPGGEYVLIGFDNRNQAAYSLEITVSEPATVYLLIDNRLGDGTPNNPPENGAPPGSWTRMTWVGTDGFAPVRTGANRAGDASIPDEVGLDEGGDGFGPGLSIQNWASVYARSVPAGPFQVRATGDATRNMYGVVLTRQNHQVLTWITPAPATPLQVGQSYPLSVASSSGLPVNYAVVRGPATLANGQVTITGPGTIELAAEQGGNASHAPAAIRRLFNRPAAPLALAGQWPGVPRGNAAGVTVVGQFAYLAAGLGGLMTFDVANPQAPVHLGTYPTTAESWDVAVGAADSRAYLADGSAGLQILDVTQPAAPVRLGGFDTLGDARGVAVVGTRVYLADGSAGLQILDASNPAAPVRLGAFDTPGFAESVVLSGNLAFVADTYTGMQIVDVTDPANPVFVGGFDTSGNTETIAVAGNLAYLADGFTGLQVFDVSNPAVPTRLGIYNTPGSAVGVSVSGTLACVADDAAGLVLVDVSNPAAPAAIGTPFDTPGFARAVTLAGNLAYVADSDAGLRIVDLAQPTAPVALGSHSTGGFARNVTLSGSLALVADAEAGLQIVDVSQPAQPVLLANFDTPGYAQNVAVSGSLALVADGFSGLRVVDLSQPSNPVALGGLGLGGYTHDVAVQGNRAWAAAEAAGLKIIDLTDPANPALLGGYDTPGAARAVTVVGSLAYVADASAGLHILDVSQPATPTLVGTIDTGRTAQDVAVSGAYAYVADWDGGLQIFDVSQPSKPVWVGAYDTPSSTERVVVSGHLAFLADTTAVLVVDVEDPTHPVPVGALETRGTALGIDVAAGLACVADREWGLQVMSWRAGIPQSIAFHPPPAVAPFGPPAILQASATGGLPVEFSVVSGPGALAGNQLSATAFGTVILQADQAGNTQFLPATIRRSIHAGSLALRGGYLKFEAWAGLSTFDNRLDATLLADPRYPAEPDFASYTSEFTSRPVYPDDTHTGYGGRISGFLTPPETGEYRFFVQSDDSARLFLSTDDQPANLALVAEEPACCNGFTEPYSPRTSVPIHLEAGRSYYVEGIWKEGAGADYLRVAWRREGDPTPAAGLPVIPASALAAWVPNDDPAELFVPDPAGNLDGDPARTSLDLLFLSLQSASGRYRLELETVAPFPAAADLGPDRRIDLVWFVDADRNLATGQSAEGDDYHVRLHLDATGWHWSWDKVSSVATGDGVANRPEDFELVVSGNRASLSFPAYYLPQPSFDVWAAASSLASPNWPPATAHPPTARGTFNLRDFDTSPPGLSRHSVRFDAGWIRLDFDEILDPGTATDPARYSVNDAPPAAVALHPDRRGVDLTVPPLTGGRARVIVTDLKDYAGNTLANPIERNTALRYVENFEGTTLRANQDETLAATQAWTHSPPAGWFVDNSRFVATLVDPNAVPPNPDADGDGYADLDGVTEWAGWSFARRDWWIQVAGDDRRSEFTLGSGNVAVADPDEWADLPHATSLFDSRLQSPPIPVAGAAPNAFRVSFASSWRPSARSGGLPDFPDDGAGNPINNQTAVVSASFDGGAPIEVLRWDSLPGSPTYHPDQPNELVFLDLPNPAGAQNVVLSFSLLDAADDWWWTVDGLEVSETPVQPRVVARHVFYNQSGFDGGNAGAGAGPADDAAIAPDKTALLPGTQATFAHYTSYPRGLNGIMVDIEGLPADPTAADFEFRAGNTPTPAEWPAAPAPASVTVRRGAGPGGSDRVTLIWGADAVKKRWLRVTVLATAATGLAQPDVFYFGNAVGETGNSVNDARVTSADALRVLSNLTTSAGVTNRFDINRDGRIGAADRLGVLGNISALDPLILLNLAGGGALQSRSRAGASRPPLTPAAQIVSGGNLRLRWIDDGTPVTLWTTESLDSTDWEILEQFPAAPIPGTQVDVVLPVDPDGPARFYRLESGGAR